MALSLRLNAQLITLRGYAQGTTFQIKYSDAANRNFQKQVDSLLADFDKSLSLYRPDSELSMFNELHSIRFTSPYLYPVLRKSAEIHHKTGGLFDPTVLPLLKAYGFGPGGKKVAEEQFDLDSVMALVGFEKIEFDSVSVRKAADHMALDFNAIAQGYSVDVISQFLENRGIQNYLVEVGGELRGRGEKPDGNLWVVGISDPEKPADLIATVKIRDRAMATSGNYRNHYRKDGRTYTHIVNPRTGQPGISDILSVTVFAPDAISADGYATAFLIMGMDRLRRELPKFPDIEVFVVYSTSDGRKDIYYSESLQPFLSRIP